ncbi:MAG: peptidase S10 [Syntrophaceae bacterium]|nr:peptidase S10 [Syntrophaceae bacterium]
MKKIVSISLVASLLIGVLSLGACQATKNLFVALETPESLPQPRDKSKAKEPPEEKISITHHSIKINGMTLNYKAFAGYLPMKDEAGKLRATIFFTSYIKDEEEDKSQRPITFAFNGGPGAASVFLHLGALGPKRMLLKEEKEALPPPYRLIENAYTWLDITDLVFIDPVGTGYSRAASGEDPKKFWGVKEDIQSVGAFIRLYLTKYNRWLSPKFIAGESYGTTRAAGLSSYLQNKLAINLNGLILISEALNFQTIVFTAGNDLPYILFLPTYATTAWYHHKLSPEFQSNFQKTMDEAEEFALNEYLVALAKGDLLSEPERNRVVEKLTRYTGLSETSIQKSKLRISRGDFTKELLRQEDLRIGVLDSRITGKYTPQDFIEDPSVFLVTGLLMATWNDYVRKELKYETDLPYEILSMKVNESWNWSSDTGGLGYVNVVDTLHQAMSENKYLKVLIASGYYDLDTPFFASKYAANHLGLDAKLRKNLTLTFYEAGHQMYTHLPALKKLKTDVANFFREAIPKIKD